MNSDELNEIRKVSEKKQFEFSFGEKQVSEEEKVD